LRARSPRSRGKHKAISLPATLSGTKLRGRRETFAPGLVFDASGTIFSGNDPLIIVKGGHDLVLANAYTNDTDIVKGGTGYDKINVADGDRHDTASGGSGGDWCIVDSRSEATASCTRVTVR
jgi:hypothetical protein